MLTYDPGILASLANQEDAAAKRFNDAINSWPSLSQAYVALSIILTKGGKFKEAKALLEKGLTAGADGPELRDRLARIFMDLDRPQEALAQITAIERQKPAFDGLPELRLTAQNIANVERPVGSGQPPILFVGILVKSGDVDLVRFVVRRWHPDLNQIPPGSVVPPLVTASLKGYLDIVKLLLDSGATVDGRDPKHGLTALIAAAVGGREDVCRELVRRGAALELQDSFGFSAFTFAAEGGHTEIARLLLDHGAKVSAKSKEGLNALDYARKYGHREIVEMIGKAQACPSGKCAP